MSFPCIACGLCCRYSGYVSELKILINEENICRNFDEKQINVEFTHHDR